MAYCNNLLFANKPFSYYVSLLGMRDNRTIIVGLQELFFNLKMGYILSRYQRSVLEPLIIKIIANNTDARVRRWAYMVGSFCINKELVRISIEQLEKETDYENRTWIMAILSYNLEEADFNKAVLRLNHDLTEDNIKLAIYLFSNSYKYKVGSSDIRRIIEKDDKISLFWIGSIAAYSDLARLRRKEIIIPDNVISDLTNHDDDEILKHIMYAYSFKDNFKVKDELKFDYYNYYNMQPHHKKWFLTAIWKDKEFIRNNSEYIREILEPRHLFLSCDKRVREGLARGLSEYDFDSSLVRSVLEWISYENETSVLHFLLLYMIKWKDLCKEYQEIINEELLHGGKIEENLIQTFVKYSDDKECEKKEDIKKKENAFYFYILSIEKFVNKEVEVMRDQYNNTGTLGNQGPRAGENSIIFQSAIKENTLENYEKIIQETTELKEYLYSNPRSEKNEILIGEIAQIQQAARERDKAKIRDILKIAGKELYDIAKKVGCSLISAYLSLQLGIK